MRQPKEIIINNKTLEQILIDHKHWLKQDCDNWEDMRAKLSNANLSYANLSNANLSNANLSDANLRGANLSNANLSNANLSYANLNNAHLSYADLSYADLSDANLRSANLRSAYLSYADLSYANLRGAYLSYADLSGANLRGADLSYADLSYANLRGADLHYANLSNTRLNDTNLYRANLRYAEGKLIEYRKGKILTEDIIGYKKCKDNIIVTLKIPRGATVFSINGSKCRTNKAEVVAIEGADRAYSIYTYMSYYVGDKFNIYNFNCEYNEECGEGIHFFMTREEAENY